MFQKSRSTQKLQACLETRLFQFTENETCSSSRFTEKLEHSKRANTVDSCLAIFTQTIVTKRRCLYNFLNITVKYIKILFHYSIEPRKKVDQHYQEELQFSKLCLMSQHSHSTLTCQEKLMRMQKDASLKRNRR